MKNGLLEEIAASSSPDREYQRSGDAFAPSFFPIAKWTREGRWIDGGHTLINNKGCPIYTQIYQFRPAANASFHTPDIDGADLSRGAYQS